jgi:hypothetical protein
MDTSALAGFGIYLVLVFIVPGFCFLLVLGLCFPTFVKDKIKFFSGTEEGKDQKEYSATVILGMAIVAGLLISSVPFAIEMVLHYRANQDHCLNFLSGYNYYLPGIPQDQIAAFEAAGRNISFLQLISGSAIMHFNVGLGIMLILLVYVIVTIFANLRNLFQASFWNGKFPRVGLVICLFLISACNLIDSKALSKRSNSAIDQISKLPPVVSTEIKPKP